MVNDTDTSDEAFQAWARKTFDIYSKLACWREAARRCEAQMEERERKGFEAGVEAISKAYGLTYPKDTWIGHVYRAFKEAQK